MECSFARRGGGGKGALHPRGRREGEKKKEERGEGSEGVKNLSSLLRGVQTYRAREEGSVGGPTRKKGGKEGMIVGIAGGGRLQHSHQTW